MRKVLFCLAGLALLSGQGCPDGNTASFDFGGFGYYDDYDDDYYDDWYDDDWYDDDWYDDGDWYYDDYWWDYGDDACAIYGWYGDGICDYCLYADPDCYY